MPPQVQFNPAGATPPCQTSWATGAAGTASGERFLTGDGERNRVMEASTGFEPV